MSRFSDSFEQAPLLIPLLIGKAMVFQMSVDLDAKYLQRVRR